MIALLNCSWISSFTLRYQRHPRDPRSFTAGDEIRNRLCNFSQSQSANQSFLIAAALAAISVSAFSTLPFKQYRYASRNVSLAPRRAAIFLALQ